MSLHLRLRPARVGSESKNISDDCGSDPSASATWMCACSVHTDAVVSESRRTWSTSESNGSGGTIGMGSAPAIGAARIHRSARKHLDFEYNSQSYSRSCISPSPSASATTGVGVMSSSLSSGSVAVSSWPVPPSLGLPSSDVSDPSTTSLL